MKYINTILTSYKIASPYLWTKSNFYVTGFEIGIDSSGNVYVTGKTYAGTQKVYKVNSDGSIVGLNMSYEPNIVGKIFVDKNTDKLHLTWNSGTDDAMHYNCYDINSSTWQYSNNGSKTAYEFTTVGTSGIDICIVVDDTGVTHILEADTDTTYGSGNRVYHITSNDGITFTRSYVLNTGNCARPKVVCCGGTKLALVYRRSGYHYFREMSTLAGGWSDEHLVYDYSSTAGDHTFDISYCQELDIVGIVYTTGTTGEYVKYITYDWSNWTEEDIHLITAETTPKPRPYLIYTGSMPHITLADLYGELRQSYHYYYQDSVWQYEILPLTSPNTNTDYITSMIYNESNKDLWYFNRQDSEYCHIITGAKILANNKSKIFSGISKTLQNSGTHIPTGRW